jgi:hypothetical protein
LFETGHHRAHRRQLPQQSTQQQQLQIFLPYMNDVLQTVSRPALTLATVQEYKKYL